MTSRGGDGTSLGVRTSPGVRTSHGIKTSPDGILRVGNVLGESILWHSRRQELWWTDIAANRLHQHPWHSDAPHALPAPDRITSFGFVAGGESLIAAFAGGIGLYDPYAQSVTWLARPEAVGRGVRFNDGRVDRRGRFWSGTMVEDERPSADGCLYSIDGGREAHCHLQGIRVSNGLCFSPDGTLIYFADSPTRTIRVYPLLEPEGVLGAPRIFAQTPEGAFPDGATVDVDGCVWTALWGAGRVVRYTPDGRVDRTIALPVSQPSCVCFAGNDLDTLCVTTAKQDLPESVLANEPHAGDVFLFRVGAQGLPEVEYRP